MWGRSPHAPAGSAHAAWPSRAQRAFDGVRLPRPEGERAFPPLWGLRPTPHPGRACAARGSGPPTRPRIFFMWGRSPHAPAGSAHAAWPSRAQRAFDGVRLPRPEGERAFPSSVGAAPHAPSRTSLRCARLWPTHPPSDLLHVGALPPRPRRVSARGVAFAGATCFRGRSGSLAPRVRVGVRAFRRPPGEKAPRAHRTHGGAPPAPQGGSTGTPLGSLGSTGPSAP